MKKFIVFAALLFTSQLLACVSTGANPSMSMHGEMATPFHLTSDAPVTVSPIRVYVQPDGIVTDPLRGLFVPLRLTQDVAESMHISRNLSRQIWQVWLAQKAFAVLEYDESVIPHQVSDALAVARAKGANVLVGGYISHYLDGGTAGKSSVSIQIEVYEVASGALIWSMGQGGAMEKKQATDLFVLGVQQRMPEDAAGLMVRSVGYDMGMKIKHWVQPPRTSNASGQVF